MKDFKNIKSIAEIHRVFGVDSSSHPLVSLIDFKDMCPEEDFSRNNYVLDFYYIALKTGDLSAFGYGRNSYDFQEGSLIFTEPGQVISPHEDFDETNISGWMLFFHPDLLRYTTLGNKMDDYHFFSYSMNEALHLSNKEKQTITDLVDKITEEYNQNIDKHSQSVIISTIELLLNYCTRFYDRQFITRTNFNKKYINQFEKIMKAYFDSDKPYELGFPTVTYCGESLGISPKYLSDLLRKETGKNTQAHIHEFIVNRAKNMLLSSNKTVSEIAYSFGFGYPQNFSKLFKKETKLSPSEYRNR